MGVSAGIAIAGLGYLASGAALPGSEKPAGQITDADGTVHDLPPETPQEIAQTQLEQSQEQLDALRSDQEATEGTAAQRAAKAAQDQRRRQIAGMFGRSDTILTNPLGQVNGTNGQRKTLLGE